MSACVPTGVSPMREVRECAASSMIGILRPRVIFATSPTRQGCPAIETMTMALVFFVSADSSFEGSRFFVEGSTSTKTGLAPRYRIVSPVLTKVYGEVTTSSPGPTPAAMSARWSAAVQEERATACRGGGVAPEATYLVTAASSSRALGPVVSQPERSTAVTASISACVMDGLWKGIEAGTGWKVAQSRGRGGCAGSGSPRGKKP